MVRNNLVHDEVQIPMHPWDCGYFIRYDLSTQGVSEKLFQASGDLWIKGSCLNRIIVSSRS